MTVVSKAAPRLSRQLVLEEQTMLADGAGGSHAEWHALGTLWAAVDSGAGREAGSLGIARSAVPMKITVRAAPSGSSLRPRPDQRFREGMRLYRITAVAEGDDKARYLTCFATEEVAT